MNEENKDQIAFRFVGVQIMSKYVNQLAEGKPIQTQYVYEVKLDTRIDPKQQFVIVSVIVSIIDSDNIENICANFTVWCIFQVIEFEKYIRLNGEGAYVVPEILERTIRPVSISTTRGIIYSDLKNTYLANTIMPVIYMDAFKQEESGAKETKRPNVNVKKAIPKKRTKLK